MNFKSFAMKIGYRRSKNALCLQPNVENIIYKSQFTEVSDPVNRAKVGLFSKHVCLLQKKDMRLDLSEIGRPQRKKGIKMKFPFEN